MCVRRFQKKVWFEIVQPINGKRRYNKDLPDALEPATKDAYDFGMADNDGDIL